MTFAGPTTIPMPRVLRWDARCWHHFLNVSFFNVSASVFSLRRFDTCYLSTIFCPLFPPQNFGGNSHSAPAGRMVYNIYGLCRRWWGGGEVTRRLQARFWSLVQIPKIANFFWRTTDRKWLTKTNRVTETRADTKHPKSGDDIFNLFLRRLVATASSKGVELKRCRETR